MQNIFKRGFTIVELMVVIAVIAILASITFVVYKTTQNEARAASLSTGLQQVQTSMVDMTTRLHSEQWPRATDFVGTQAPNLSVLLAPGYTPSAGQTTLTTLRSILPNGVPKVSGVDGIEWLYRNDGGTHSPSACDGKGVDGRQGPLLEITNVPSEVMTQLNVDADDGKDDCGKIRIYNGALTYQLGFTQMVD